MTRNRSREAVRQDDPAEQLRAERRAIAREGLRRKYAKVLLGVDLGESDLAEMGPTLRAYCESRMRQREWIWARLRWPEDPEYDDRAFGLIGMTPEAMSD